VTSGFTLVLLNRSKQVDYRFRLRESKLFTLNVQP